MIVNPNTDVRVTGWLAAEARCVAGENYQIVAVNAASGLAAIETPDQVAEAAPAVEAEIVAHRDAGAAIIGAFGDPGVRKARARAHARDRPRRGGLARSGP